MAQPAFATITRTFVNLALPLISRWVTNSPRAQDAPFVHRSGPNALRLLLIGDGNAVGYGVLSHQVGFGGAVAGQIAAGTGRGVDLEIVAEDGMTADACHALLTDIDLAAFDGVILNIGLTDALKLVSPTEWEPSVRRVLEHLEDAEVPTFVVAIPVASEDGPTPAPVRRLFRESSRALTDVLRREVGRTAGSEFVPLGSLEGRRFAGRPIQEYYQGLACQVAPIVSAAIAHSVRQPRAQDEQGRQRALEDTGILDTPPEAGFDRIVLALKRMFDVPMAAVTFIDDDRQWMKASVGLALEDTPRSLAICNTTIQTEGLLLVPNTWDDPRFSHSPGTDRDDAVRFYAGYPLETPDGYRVGALCIMDYSPHHRFSSVDGAVLRDFALEVQRQLWLTSKVNVRE